MALWGYIRNANCCCFCQTICNLQIAAATPRLYQKCTLQIDAVIARLYWCHKCNLQIAAAIARLDEKCLLLPLLQDDTTNAYYKLMLFLQDYTKNAYCKLLLLQSVAVIARHIGNWFLNSRNTLNHNASLTVYILCFPPVHSTKEQRLLQCSNIFSSYDTKFWF